MGKSPNLNPADHTFASLPTKLNAKRPVNNQSLAENTKGANTEFGDAFQTSSIHGQVFSSKYSKQSYLKLS